MTDTDTTSPIIAEILAGDALSLSAAARKLPPHRGRNVAPSTIWRWHREGLRTPDGRRVHLELARVGGKWLASAAALARFIAAATPPIPCDTPLTPRGRTAKQEQSAAERAGARLEKRKA